MEYELDAGVIRQTPKQGRANAGHSEGEAKEKA